MEKRFREVLIYIFSLALLLMISLVAIIFSIDCGTGICDGPGLAILILVFIVGITAIYSIVYWLWIKKHILRKSK